MKSLGFSCRTELWWEFSRRRAGPAKWGHVHAGEGRLRSHPGESREICLSSRPETQSRSSWFSFPFRRNSYRSWICSRRRAWKWRFANASWKHLLSKYNAVLIKRALESRDNLSRARPQWRIESVGISSRLSLHEGLGYKRELKMHS